MGKFNQYNQKDGTFTLQIFVSSVSYLKLYDCHSNVGWSKKHYLRVVTIRIQKLTNSWVCPLKKMSVK